MFGFNEIGSMRRPNLSFAGLPILATACAARTANPLLVSIPRKRACEILLFDALSRWLVFDDSFLRGVLIGHLLCAPKPSADEYSLVVSVICHIHRISSSAGLFLGIAAGSPGGQSRKVCEEGTIC
jgi:hypothetical protein